MSTRHRRAGAAFIAIVTTLSAAGCGSGSSNAFRLKDLPDVVTDMRRHPLRFEFDELGVGNKQGGRFTVAGLIEDEYRYTTMITLNGSDVVQEIDADDARYVRVVDPNALPAGIANAGAADAVKSGQWLGDLRGAPGDIVTTTAPANPIDALLGPRLALRQVRFLEQLTRLLATAATRTRWNPNASNYLVKNDHFAPHKEDGDRFDFLPAAFDPDRVLRDGIPADVTTLTDKYFRYTAVWVKHGAITRVESLVDVPENFSSGVERAVRSQAKRLGQRVVDVRASAAAALSITSLQQTWLFSRPDGSEHVSVPDNALPVNFTQLITTLGVSP